jgi:two-component system response regulator AtoC
MGHDDEPWDTRTLRPPRRAPAPGDDLRFYLLVVYNGSSSLFHLPPTGTVLIGRSPTADLQLADEAASRSHATILCADGVAQVRDLGSHNGTFLNGERVEGTRALLSGDVLAIGDVTLVLHAEVRAPERRPTLDPAALRQRLAEEVERSTRFQRPLAIVALLLGPEATRESVAAGVVGKARGTDVVGWFDDALLLLLLPEGGAEARAIGASLAASVRDARVGMALCPADACDVDTLVAAARAAAAGAPPATMGLAADTSREIRLGDRTIVVADPAMMRLFELIGRLAASQLPVLILGETGAGKEGAAMAVHYGSPRAAGPFVTINCAAIPEHLVESELFGHARGAFSGAIAAKAGKLEAAHKGTLFLDEIGELPLAVQAKLLRALEERRITRVGAVAERPVDLRVVAATNRSLEAEVAAGRFREDLFFRLGAATVVLPPLRDRPREVPILARRFLADACARLERPLPAFSLPTMRALMAYRWPGNVRELRNAIEYVAATVEGAEIQPHDLPGKIGASSGASAADDLPAAEAPPDEAPTFRPLSDELRELERSRMAQALAASQGVQRRAAELIGMPLRTFVMKVKQYNLSSRSGRE